MRPACVLSRLFAFLVVLCGHVQAATEAPAKYVWVERNLAGYEATSPEEICLEIKRRNNIPESVFYEPGDNNPDSGTFENGLCKKFNPANSNPPYAGPALAYRCAGPSPWIPQNYTTASSFSDPWPYFKGSQSRCFIADTAIRGEKSVGECETCSKNSPGATVGNPITLGVGNCAANR